MYKIGLITVSTNEYRKKYLDKFLYTFEKNFCPKDSFLYLFTDKKKAKVPKNVKQFIINHYAWPVMPLLRFKLLYENINNFDNDFVYYIDSDVYFKQNLQSQEIMGDLVGVLHRNLLRKRKEFNYEKNIKSSAYIPEHQGTHYFIGGFFGGRNDEFQKAVKTISNNIELDISNNIRAVWGDESHINRYFIEHPPTKILSPFYMMPEYIQKSKEKAKIIHITKDFKKVNLGEALIAQEEIDFEALKTISFTKRINKKKILITGHLGYIGAKLLKYLNKKNIYNIKGIDLKEGNNILYYDFGKEQYDIILHLASQTGAIPSIKNPIWDAQNNILSTIKIVKQFQDSKIIFTTSGASLEPESPYGLSKKTCEEYIKLLHNNYIICRLSSVYGGKDRGVVDDFIRARTLKIYGNGRSTRDFVHVDDIVLALEKAISWKVGEYSLGSNFGTKVLDIAKATKKKYVFLRERRGEKKKVVLNNTTPNWKPKIKVLDYIKNYAK